MSQEPGIRSTPRIVRPEQMSARALWPSEARDFTPWLAENLDCLATLDLGPLECEQVEAMLPDLSRSLDILATTLDGRRVAIENQYHGLDHDHLTRGLAYAVGHEAGALVLIAKEHKSEFVAVAGYLNRAQESLGEEQGIAVFLVRLSVERVDDAYIPRFEVLSRPNTWRAAASASDASALSSVDEFFALCDDQTRPLAKEIVTRWRDAPGSSIRLGAKNSVSLDLANRAKPGGGRTSVFVLYSTGSCGSTAVICAMGA